MTKAKNIASFPDPHTQQRMDYITTTNAYQAGDETTKNKAR